MLAANEECACLLAMPSLPNICWPGWREQGEPFSTETVPIQSCLVSGVMNVMSFVDWEGNPDEEDQQ